MKPYKSLLLKAMRGVFGAPHCFQKRTKKNQSMQCTLCTLLCPLVVTATIDILYYIT